MCHIKVITITACRKMVRLAPSAGNKQPWRAVICGERVHFYEKKTMADNPLGDIQKVDIGIALVHFDLTMEENGTGGRFMAEDPGFRSDDGMEYIIESHQGISGYALKPKAGKRERIIL